MRRYVDLNMILKCIDDHIKLYDSVYAKTALNDLYGHVQNFPTNDFKIGHWMKVPGGMTPGGTAVYVCEACKGSEHLHGAEYPKRKLICNKCGTVNIYPWETVYDKN